MRTITLLLFDGVNALDAAGPLEAFACVRGESGRRLYEARSLSLDGRVVRSESGLRLDADGALKEPPEGHLLIIPGGEGIRAPARLARAASWLKRYHKNFRRVAAVCTGAYALAAAGLLDDRKATTHWRWARDLARAYPKVDVDPNTLFVRDGKFWTSGGIAAGIDLALALIEDDHGAQVAIEVARELVVFLRRTGGQAQFSEPLKFQSVASDRLSDVCAWAAANLHRDLCVETLAARAHLSPRQFSRLFKEAMGMPPARYIARLRLDSAQAGLSEPKATIAQVADVCGFGSADAFRRAFGRQFLVNPSEYQRRFAAREEMK